MYSWAHQNELETEIYQAQDTPDNSLEKEGQFDEKIFDPEDFRKSKFQTTRQTLIAQESGPRVYEYFKEYLNIEDPSVIITATSTAFNISNISGENVRAIINLKKINEVRFVNKFFETANSRLPYSGMFIGCVETNKQRYHRIASKFPPVLRNLVIIIDLIINRILPRINFIKTLYTNLTSGAIKTVSKAEILGRLVCCGFDIIEYKEINNLTYFVVMKTNEPVVNPTSSYGALFKMPRIGKNGKIIHVYKFRTMHPYSEYLQDYVLKLNGYSAVGKPADDFRLTRLGKFMRKFWIDEIPQIINVLKGEMAIVGIRPLSKRAFQDYPEDVKKMRIKYKPGCIPPYVALLKQGLEQSIEAEREYLTEKDRNSLATDIKYFRMAVFNILTNKIRSA
jgi:lipopolysaccharide/colanic/teichoic acid biosynthesis glycosyltransferase